MAITIVEHKQSTYPNSRQFNVRIPNTNNINIHYTIKTTVTQSPIVVTKWIYDMFKLNPKHHTGLIIGLGVQWTNTGLYGQERSAATLQLCVGNQCLVFQLGRSLNCPNILRGLLTYRWNTFVGLENQNHSKKLAMTHHRLQMLENMPVDLRKYYNCNIEKVAGPGLSAKEIVRRVLGIDLEFDHEVLAMTDWEIEELTLPQIKLVTVEAFVSYAVGKKIKVWKMNRNWKIQDPIRGTSPSFSDWLPKEVEV